MGILARLFGATSKAELGGIRLRDSQPWEVSSTTDVWCFLRALPLLAPQGAFVYFEGTAEPQVSEYLRRVSIPEPVQVAVGTIWPRPDRYHIPLTAESMEELASFLEETPVGYFCTHCHVHRNGTVLLEWHDAFGDDPIRISRAIDSDDVGRFALALGSSYGSKSAG